MSYLLQVCMQSLTWGKCCGCWRLQTVTHYKLCSSKSHLWMETNTKSLSASEQTTAFSLTHTHTHKPVSVIDLWVLITLTQFRHRQWGTTDTCCTTYSRMLSENCGGVDHETCSAWLSPITLRFTSGVLCPTGHKYDRNIFKDIIIHYCSKVCGW